MWWPLIYLQISFFRAKRLLCTSNFQYIIEISKDTCTLFPVSLRHLKVLGYCMYSLLFFFYRRSEYKYLFPHLLLIY